METEKQCVYNTFRKNTDKSTVREFYVNDTPLFSRELVTNNSWWSQLQRRNKYVLDAFEPMFRTNLNKYRCVLTALRLFCSNIPITVEKILADEVTFV